MKVEALAKINLTLEVLGVRADGYHALRSVVMPVSLSDTLEFSKADDLTSDTGYSDDLCLKAARRLDARRGVRISVTKRIPVGGGLGGGSANAAATLKALNRLWRCGYTRSELISLAADVGSDVPSLVAGGAVVMSGRGDNVQPLVGLEAASRIAAVLVFPNVACSTSEIYRLCTPRERPDDANHARMLSALEAGDAKAVAAALQNDLWPPAISTHHEIAAAFDILCAVGSPGVSMSGSGSTVFGLADDLATAQAYAAELTRRGWRACAVSFVPVAFDDEF